MRVKSRIRRRQAQRYARAMAVLYPQLMATVRTLACAVRELHEGAEYLREVLRSMERDESPEQTSQCGPECPT